jgi:hypothetical protein
MSVSQSLKDGTRTNLPKPSRVVWEKTEYGRKIKVNKQRLALPRGIEALFSP